MSTCTCAASPVPHPALWFGDCPTGHVHEWRTNLNTSVPYRRCLDCGERQDMDNTDWS